MNYFDSKLQKKKLSFNDFKVQKEIDNESYCRFIRKEFTNEEKWKNENIDYNHLENIFSNEIYYKAMKDLSKNEKRLLGYIFLDNKSLEEVCKELRLTKEEGQELKNDSIEHFKLLVEKYSKLLSKKGGDLDD